MIVKSVKTHKITTKDTDIFTILDKYLPAISEKSIVVIASKIIAITQGKVVVISEKDKDELIKKEADFYLPKEAHKHGLYITIKDNYLTYSSGIDESNTEKGYILWPSDIQKVANEIRIYLKNKFNITNIGVIVTDMTAIPLKWGVIGGALTYSGFNPLKDLTDKPDVFGKKFKYTKVGILNGLAAAGAVVMGEGNEQTPLGVITDIPFVEFVDRNPTEKELAEQVIKPEEDLYGPLFRCVDWKKGRK